MSYSTCKLCGNKPLHFFPRKGKSAGKACFVDYHSDSFFGLATDDRTVVNSSTKWTPPSQTKRKRNAREIANLKTGDSNSESSPTS